VEAATKLDHVSRLTGSITLGLQHRLPKKQAHQSIAKQLLNEIHDLETVTEALRVVYQDGLQDLDLLVYDEKNQPLAALDLCLDSLNLIKPAERPLTRDPVPSSQ
jgi:hypothetical protein